MRDLDERQMLDNILAGVFQGILEYNEQMRRQLAERILTEIDVDRSKFDIHTAVCRKSKFDPINDFLYPVVPNDILTSGYDIAAISEKINQNGEALLFTIFMECSPAVISDLLSKESAYKSIIATDQNSYTANVQLRPSIKYPQAVENLYEIFQYNGIAWKIVLVDAPPIDASETIKEITVNLGAYEQYKKIDMLLLWNINGFSVKNTSFPTPAYDVIHYEYTLPLQELGLEHGYLAKPDNNEIKYVKSYPANMTLISANAAVKQWNLLKVCQRQPEELNWISYPLASNSEKFIGRYARPPIIRKQAEIHSLINSLEAAKDFSFKKIQILDKVDNLTQTYNLNCFMPDNIRGRFIEKSNAADIIGKSRYCFLYC